MPSRGESDAEDAPDADKDSSTWDSLRRRSTVLLAKLPRPARLLWICLLILGAYAIVFTVQGAGVVPLIALPALAVETDVLFQMFRYRKIRAPDAAMATGLLLALLLPPSVSLVSLLEFAGVASAAIALRHVLRVQDRPLFNPAAAGVLMGALFFGLAPSWWGSIGMWLVVVLGILVTLRTAGSWRIPVAFFVSYGVLSVLGNLILGEVTSPMVLLLGAVDPAMLFFGFFMVPEPRSSVSRPGDRWIFGLVAGVASGILPALLPSLAPLVALLIANLAAAFLRRSQVFAAPQPEARATRRPSKRERARKRRQPVVQEVRSEWKTPQRVASGILVVVLLGGMAFALNAPTTTHFTAVRPSLPAAAGNLAASSNCTADNPSVPSDVLTLLHQRLGPSVILSADTNTGTVVFYDPVNHATITETNIYEDYGFAEFNGDDYAVMGCAA